MGLSRAQEELARTRRALEQVANDGTEPTTDYHRVHWQKRMKHWRVKVRYKEWEFHKVMEDLDTAAWVADCAALYMRGPEAFYSVQHEFMMNYNWRYGEHLSAPPCPDPNISVFTVYGWIRERGIPCVFMPSDLLYKPPTCR